MKKVEFITSYDLLEKLCFFPYEETTSNLHAHDLAGMLKHAIGFILSKFMDNNRRVGYQSKMEDHKSEQ